MPDVNDMVLRSVSVIIASALVCGCATAPARPQPPAISFDQKMSWILQLEDQRIERLAAPPTPPVTAARRGGPPPAAAALTPDLAQLIVDPDGRVRRRAALAIGRVGLEEG